MTLLSVIDGLLVLSISKLATARAREKPVAHASDFEDFRVKIG